MSEMPELREGPPWAMEEMILAEPGIVGAILSSEAAREAAAWIEGATPVVTTGCGTSEHAAMAGALLLGARARDAFEAALDPQEGGVLVAVSHEGGTAATLAALEAARGAQTVLITASDSDAADLAIRTPLRDTSWCHTVGYLSPLLAFVAIAGARIDAQGIVEDVLGRRARFTEAAAELAGCERLLVGGSGADEGTARGLALEIEGGGNVPTPPPGLEEGGARHRPRAAGPGEGPPRPPPRRGRAHRADPRAPRPPPGRGARPPRRRPAGRRGRARHARGDARRAAHGGHGGRRARGRRARRAAAD